MRMRTITDKCVCKYGTCESGAGSGLGRARRSAVRPIYRPCGCGIVGRRDQPDRANVTETSHENQAFWIDPPRIRQKARRDECGGLEEALWRFSLLLLLWLASVPSYCCGAAAGHRRRCRSCDGSANPPRDVVLIDHTSVPVSVRLVFGLALGLCSSRKSLRVGGVDILDPDV